MDQSEIVQSVNAIKSSHLKELSKQQIVDCTNNAIYMNFGCSGGHVSNSLQYVIDYGLVEENVYPYKNNRKQCELFAGWPTTGISEYAEIGYLDVNKMMDSIVKYGPLIAYVAASSIYFQLYASGVLDDSSCITYGIDHVVLIVGFGWDNVSNKDYWLIKNSWGTDWGEVLKFYLLKNTTFLF
jgi:C1A family cysteine protease